MALVVLIAVLCLALFLIPLGLPGTWVMVAAAVGYSYLVANSIGWVTLAAIVSIAFIAEILEITVAGRYTKKYGGSNRSSWGAIIGGLIGVVMGVPIPVIGSVIGGFLGAFLGAMAFEYSHAGDLDVSARAATGAVVGRGAAAALKVALGMVIAAWVVAAAIS